MTRHGFLVALVCAVWLGVPTVTLADWFDNFNDGYYERTPNDPRYDANDPYWTNPNNCVLWDIDNPDWEMHELIGEVWAEGIDDGWLRLYVQGQVMMGLAFLGAGVEDYQDPNVSFTFYDDSAPHYIMALTKTNDPTQGATYVFLHADVITWTGYGFRKAFHPNDSSFAITHFNATDYTFGIKRDWPDPNTAPDEENGFWFAFQFDPDDPNGTGDANDPNNHWFRVAAWNGGKHGWDGEWFMEFPVIHPNWPPGDPNLDMNFDEGISVVAVAGTGDIGIVPDMSFDHVEVRWGSFTNVSRALTITMKDCCDLKIDPDLLDDPNHDPNDLGELRRYTHETGVVLHAAVPCGNKSFKKWTIKGPNDSGDPLYQIVTDTNEVVYLTMDGDYLVKATCKCGGGGIEPFAATVLLVLGLTVVIRRLT